MIVIKNGKVCQIYDPPKTRVRMKSDKNKGKHLKETEDGQAICKKILPNKRDNVCRNCCSWFCNTFRAIANAQQKLTGHKHKTWAKESLCPNWFYKVGDTNFNIETMFKGWSEVRAN